MGYIIQMNQMEITIDFIRLYFINLFTYYTLIKITNSLSIKKKIEIIYICLVILALTMVCKWTKDNFNFLFCIISQIILIAVVFLIRTKRAFGYSVMNTMIALTINYIIFSISIFINFIVFLILRIENDYINLLIMITIYLILVRIFTRVRKFKKGFAFLQCKLKNEYFDILFLNISCIILFSIIVLSNYEMIKSRTFGIGLIIFSIIMFITIQKSLQLYYKQKMLIKDLEETKEELEDKKKEVEALEKENLAFSKMSHSIVHRQKSLEYKLKELSMKNEIAEEIDIKSRLEKINTNMTKEAVVTLDKTGISEIDDMLKYMQSECVKNKIDFQLQISGNIYKIINNYIDKEELEILIADHIKNAIIAIKYSKNINKSILVRLGKLDGIYGLYIYDSGIEFEIETLLNLGKKPATTHKDSGGTGIGFMNTFDTLRKNESSFILEEYGKPMKDNFTKALKFKFDKKHEFKIYSYRYEKIRNQDKEKNLKVENLQF